MNNYRSLLNPFDLRDGRAMISLGSLSKSKYCTFSCPFCYVQAGFNSYVKLNFLNINNWIKCLDGNLFDIIYISGDTDSFAPPRTSQGLDLMESLVSHGKDVLFTTRHVFNEYELNRLKNILEIFQNRSLNVYGCISVAQMTVPFLEPNPIKSTISRINQLRIFNELGLKTILAIRPFLPIVPLTDYAEIVNLSKEYSHAVLGEYWYADLEGILESNVLGPGIKLSEFTLEAMPFDNNLKIWKVYKGEHIRNHISSICEINNLPFFMRSRDAINFIRSCNK